MRPLISVTDRWFCSSFYERCFSWLNGIIPALLPANISKRASFTANVVVVLSYMMTIEASISYMYGSPMAAGVSLKRANASVASSKISHTCHAVFLPFPGKADTVLQPLNAGPNCFSFPIEKGNIALFNWIIKTCHVGKFDFESVVLC